MRRLLAAVFAFAAVLAIIPGARADWRVVRWIGPQRCEVLSYKPPFGRWEELALTRTRKDADRALDVLTLRRQCRASRLADLRPEPRPKP
ncbi:MAG: hypothetical protein HYU60_04945 [Magnetospirillum sp.]|nr:hypothetical protein [Magnetospirillum sp.]